jgi:ribosomal protein S18 acetylase RimI-like enzyme
MDNLLQLKRNQVERAAKILARAFENDSLHIAYFPNSSLRVEFNYHLMKFSLRYCMRFGEVYTTSPNLEGFALWQFLKSKEEEENKPNNLFVNWLSFRLEIALGEAVEKVYSIYDCMISTQYELVPSPHWYFFIIGVDPQFQGKGYATRLIKPMLARIDDEHLGCYLDTNNENNVAIYQHFGFKVLKKYQIPGADVINWSMFRENRL